MLSPLLHKCPWHPGGAKARAYSYKCPIMRAQVSLPSDDFKYAEIPFSSPQLTGPMTLKSVSSSAFSIGALLVSCGGCLTKVGRGSLIASLLDYVYRAANTPFSVCRFNLEAFDARKKKKKKAVLEMSVMMRSRRVMRDPWRVVGRS